MLTKEDCHFCAQAKDVLSRLRDEYDLRVREVMLESEEGRSLALESAAPFPPVVFLNGETFFWHETALLHAYLACNGRTRILASLSMLHYARRAELARLIPSYRPREDQDGLAVGCAERVMVHRGHPAIRRGLMS